MCNDFEANLMQVYLYQIITFQRLLSFCCHEQSSFRASFLRLDLLANLEVLRAMGFLDEFGEAKVISFHLWASPVDFLTWGRRTIASRFGDSIDCSSNSDSLGRYVNHMAVEWWTTGTSADTHDANHCECLKAPFAKSEEELSSAEGISF